MQSQPSPSATISTSNSPDSAGFLSVRKRNRVPLSCGPCRTRKLRCDRAQPCDKCRKRGDAGSCTYSSSVTKRRPTGGMQASPDEMRSRIDRLENLVLSLVSQDQVDAEGEAEEKETSGPHSIESTEDPSDGDMEKIVKRLGVFKVDEDRSVYVPETHWYAILSEISEVKTFFKDNKSQYEAHAEKVKEAAQVGQRPGTLLLSGLALPKSTSEILEIFPSKDLADILIGKFFEVHDPALHIIHGPTFQIEYDQFWTEPEKVTYAWLGLAFSMMCIPLWSFSKTGDEPEMISGQAYELLKLYRVLTAQCILKTDLSFPQSPSVEAMVLHLHAENVMTPDLEPGLLQLAALTVRSAMRMGYHVDSAPFPNIKPFQAEMRRRTWALVRQYDLTIASQQGLPPVVRSCDTNTRLPLNVYDDELYAGMVRLPEGRPLSEVTPSTYMILKSKLMRLFAAVLQVSQGVSSCAQYEEILKLDSKLEECVKNLPSLFQFDRTSQDSKDPPSIIMQRIVLELIFLRSRTFLHRRWICRSFTEARYTYSRNVCIDASARVLGLQCLLTSECLPGGRLAGRVSWHACSFTQTDFFLAGMMIAWDLHVSAELEESGDAMMASWPQEKVDGLIYGLDRNLEVWDMFQQQSVDAYKAFTILSVVLKKIKDQRRERGIIPLPIDMYNCPNSTLYPRKMTSNEAHNSSSSSPMLATSSDRPGSNSDTSSITGGVLDQGTHILPSIGSKEPPTVSSNTRDDGIEVSFQDLVAGPAFGHLPQEARSTFLNLPGDPNLSTQFPDDPTDYASSFPTFPNMDIDMSSELPLGNLSGNLPSGFGGVTDFSQFASLGVVPELTMDDLNTMHFLTGMGSFPMTGLDIFNSQTTGSGAEGGHQQGGFQDNGGGLQQQNMPITMGVTSSSVAGMSTLSGYSSNLSLPMNSGAPASGPDIASANRPIFSSVGAPRSKSDVRSSSYPQVAPFMFNKGVVNSGASVGGATVGSRGIPSSNNNTSAPKAMASASSIGGRSSNLCNSASSPTDAIDPDTPSGCSPETPITNGAEERSFKNGGIRDGSSISSGIGVPIGVGGQAGTTSPAWGTIGFGTQNDGSGGAGIVTGMDGMADVNTLGRKDLKLMNGRDGKRLDGGGVVGVRS